MDDREDGELSSNEDNVDYVPVTRPDASQYRRATQHLPSSDEEYDSDSDSFSPCLPKKKRTTVKRMDTDSQPQSEDHSNAARHTWPQNSNHPTNGHSQINKSKRNNIWANVLGEQCLSEEINIVGLKKLDGDRNVENYDFKAAQALRRQDNSNSDNDEDDNLEEHKESNLSIEKRLGRKRALHTRVGTKNRTNERNLVDIELDNDYTDEELGHVIAEALFEQKPELIVRVVQVLGKETALKLYTDTKDIESDGGMMTVDGFRRRTSGGVYLQLLKKLPNIQPEQMQVIFPPMEKSLQWGRRKRVPRRRVRHDSKPQGSKTETESNNAIDDQLSDSAVGVKCPGSTPVTSPQQSDSDEQHRNQTVVESEKLEEAIVAAKIDAKINKSRERESTTSYGDDVFEFTSNADEMELF